MYFPGPKSGFPPIHFTAAIPDEVSEDAQGHCSQDLDSGSVATQPGALHGAGFKPAAQHLLQDLPTSPAASSTFPGPLLSSQPLVFKGGRASVPRNLTQPRGLPSICKWWLLSLSFQAQPPPEAQRPPDVSGSSSRSRSMQSLLPHLTSPLTQQHLAQVLFRAPRTPAALTLLQPPARATHLSQHPKTLAWCPLLSQVLERPTDRDKSAPGPFSARVRHCCTIAARACLLTFWPLSWFTFLMASVSA